MKLIIKFFIIVLSIMSLSHIIPGIAVAGFYPAIIVAIVLGVLNFTVKPIVTIITLPVNIITLGLFGLIVNGLILWFIGSFIQGFTVATFMAAFLGALVVSFVNWVVSKV